jgi:CelD/BcsL family acetyltransferase involved in cellulose biosynthesis
MLEIEANSWKAGANIAVTSNAYEQPYYQALLPFLAEQGLLAASVHYLDGAPIAYQLSYSFGGKLGNLKNSFDERHKALSPGTVIIKGAVQRAFEIGATEFDFLGDAQPYKVLWTDRVRAHATYYLFSRRLRSRFVGALKSWLHRPQRRSTAVAEPLADRSGRMSG